MSSAAPFDAADVPVASSSSDVAAAASPAAAAAAPAAAAASSSRYVPVVAEVVVDEDPVMTEQIKDEAVKVRVGHSAPQWDREARRRHPSSACELVAERGRRQLQRCTVV